MTNHAKAAAEKIRDRFSKLPSVARMLVPEAAEPIIQSAIDAATAPLREEIERLKLATADFVRSPAELKAMTRLSNNGRNAENNFAGIPTGSDLHLCEMLIAEIDAHRVARLSDIDEAYERAARVAASAAEIERVVGRKDCAELAFVIAETILEYAKGDRT